MLDQGRFELMKKDLCKAAVTIQKLKQQRDEYKVSYELLKEESVSKRDAIRNQMYLESLRDNNVSLQNELRKYCKLLGERDRMIVNLQEKLNWAQRERKYQERTFRDIEEAREELNYEISNTTFNSKNYTHYTETLSLFDKFMQNLSRAPIINKIFKDCVKCKKRFKSLVENENYSMSFNYLLKFLNELIESFRFCEDSDTDSDLNSVQLPNPEHLDKKKYLSGLREENEFQSSRLEQLQKKLSNTLNSPKKDQNSVFHKKLSNSEACKNLGLVNEKNKKNTSQKSVSYFDESLEPPHKYSNKDTQESFCESGSRVSRSVAKSKSPPRNALSPKGRFEEFQVPFKKIQGSASVAECLGRSQQKK